jgi:hypothetical protein
MPFAFIQNSSKTNIPCISCQVNGSVVDSISTLQITQIFQNTVSNNTVCTVNFGNDLQVIVYNIKVISGKTTLEFAIEEIPESELAKQIPSSVQQGMNLSSDAIQVVIGKIHKDEKITVVYSATIFANYKSDHSISFPFSPPKNMNQNEIDLIIDFDDIDIISVNLPFQVSQATQKILCKAKLPSTQLNLEIKFQNPLKCSGFTSSIEGYDYLGLSLISNFCQSTQTKTEYFLVIDCSGSMSGKNIVMARETLKYFIRSLPDNSLFNVIQFGSNFEVMF